MKEIKREYYKRIDSRNYKKTYETTDEQRVIESLANALKYKYIYKASSIRSIKCIPNYDGTETFTIYYNGTGDKEVLTVKR